MVARTRFDALGCGLSIAALFAMRWFRAQLRKNLGKAQLLERHMPEVGQNTNAAMFIWRVFPPRSKANYNVTDASIYRCFRLRRTARA